MTAIAGVKAGLPRPVDLIIALAGLLLLSPIVALAAIAIAVTSDGPLFFRQKRVGHNGRRFLIYKLRTMRLANRGPGVTAGDDVRITPVGALLRKTKIDELPELWNVVIGDMSLVGPRPEVPQYVDLNDPMWRVVLEARPGITDPLTLQMRNEETLLAGIQGDRERFYLEQLQPYKLRGYLTYLQARDWKVDLRVLWDSLVVVILPRMAPPPHIDEIASPRNGENAQPASR
jgi:lipopolysaccharide/colanic/teichoic acid biosynthesis glycosyltransferase